MAVSDQKVLISGGCNAKGAFQDAFTFHLGKSLKKLLPLLPAPSPLGQEQVSQHLSPLSFADTLTWSAVVHSDLCSIPRAGHTLLNLTSVHLTDMDKENRGKCSQCTVLVFGGSDSVGKFYNSTSKIQLDLEEWKGAV